MDQILEEQSQGPDGAVSGNGLHVEDVFQPTIDMGRALQLAEGLDIGMVFPEISGETVEKATLMECGGGP
jgi:hypothetical protein